jgi:hypothetical protein
MEYRTIAKTVYKVSDFLSWQRSGSLILSPNFQRRAVWPEAAKSYFMDSIVQGLPVPIVFLRERSDLDTLEPKREVVDGQQRLRTLISFIEPRLLENYNPEKDDFVVKKSHNAQIAGKKFKELENETRHRILNYEFSVHILPSDTEDAEILQIFARMNSTGIKLNDQELRNAEFFGMFKQSVYRLAFEQLNRWREWKVFSETEIARMLEVEEVSDLVLLMVRDVHTKSQKKIDDFYREHEERFPQKSEIETRFRLVMDKIDETVGSKIPDTVFSKRPLFNTLFTFYYELMFGLGRPLDKTKAKPVPTKIGKAITAASNRIEKGKLPEKLAKILRGATGNLESRRIRLKFLRSIFKNV